MAVYESDPDQESDSGFVRGQLEHLVVGSQGRLLDTRRTPVVVVAVDPRRGSFVMEIEAFEDRGARWELALDEVGRFQFPRSAPTAPSAAVADLSEARERFGGELHIDVDRGDREATLEAIGLEQRRAAARLSASGVPPTIELESYVGRRRGDPRLMVILEDFLAEHGVTELDREFAGAFVSNPRAGEIVKGHAIVLAELGLCPYHGTIARDPDLLSAPWPREARRLHVIARLAFMRALWAFWNLDMVTLYRAAATEGRLEAHRPSGSFISATFSSQVAKAHFEGGPSTVAAALWRQQLSIDRFFMTFLETAALNERFAEAEAVLIADPANPLF
jgi:hypothetical protein